jgi:hypothetical protein
MIRSVERWIKPLHRVAFRLLVLVRHLVRRHLLPCGLRMLRSRLSYLLRLLYLILTVSIELSIESSSALSNAGSPPSEMHFPHTLPTNFNRPGSLTTSLVVISQHIHKYIFGGGGGNRTRVQNSY